MNYSTADYLNQLETDRQGMVTNLTTKGITGLTGDETFTELVPEVLNIPSGGGTGNLSFKELKITKLSTQNGTPSPNNQVIVNTVSSISITVSNGTLSNTVSIPLNGNEICGIGNYKDELVIDQEGNCILYKNVEKKIYTGSENWNKGEEIFYVYPSSLKSYALTDNPLLLSNYFVGEQDASSNNSIYIPGNQSYFWLNTDIANTALQLKNWLSSHNTAIYYPITQTETINLGKVNITFYQGYNTITNNVSANMEVLYVDNQ